MSDKLAAPREAMREFDVSPEEVCVVAADDTDVRIMQAVGLLAAPSDGSTNALAVADIRLSARGGGGAVRELAEILFAYTGMRMCSDRYD